MLRFNPATAVGAMLDNPNVLIAIKSFNGRPKHWDELKTQITQSPVRDSLIHEALSQVRAVIEITKHCGESHPDTQLVVDPIFLEL